MAEYIELSELQKFCKKYTEVDAIGLILAGRTDLIPTANVVERSKVNKAIEDIQELIKGAKLPTVNIYNKYSEGLQDCLEIVEKV